VSLFCTAVKRGSGGGDTILQRREDLVDNGPEGLRRLAEAMHDDGHPDWDAYQLSGDPDFRFWDNGSAPPREHGGEAPT